MTVWIQEKRGELHAYDRDESEFDTAEDRRNDTVQLTDDEWWKVVGIIDDSRTMYEDLCHGFRIPITI